MLAEGRVGPAAGGDGAVLPSRLEGTGAIVSANLHGMYAEQVRRGNVMIGANAVAGVSPGTAFSTTPPLALWNPPSSGKLLVILKASVGYVSGTIGAGNIAYGVVPSQTTVPTTGTELTPANCLLGFPRGVGRLFTGSTFVAAPTILRSAFTAGAFLASTALSPTAVVDLADGEFIVAQGAAIALQATPMAAGSSPLVILGLTWEEVPA